MDSNSQQIRLNKFLAERLGVSRREADEIIAEGKVFVNGERAVIGERIDNSSKVCYNKKIIPFLKKYTYLLLNKPVGYVSSRKKQGETPTLYELLPEKYQNLKTVGRLDKDSSGLILLTDDGDFAFRMTHPKFFKVKIYKVKLNRDLAQLHQQMISDFGIKLPDGISRLGLIRIGEGEKRMDFRVEMSEGRNRQIRRTFEALGYKVIKLHREEFGEFSLGGLKPGEIKEVKI